MVFGSPLQLHKLKYSTFNAGGEIVELASSARNLGIVLDSTFSMTAHITEVCRRFSHQLRNLSHIRRYLTVDTARTVVQALMSSRLDFNNSLYYGIANYQLQKLQRIQNAASRIILRKRKYKHITKIQLNAIGATLKMTKTNIGIWKRNIEEYFESLNYSQTTKELNNKLTQHIYTAEDVKYTFDFHSTGRIVIKTKNLDKLLTNFIERDEVIFGTKLKMVEKYIPSPSPRKISTPETPRDYKAIRGYDAMYENQKYQICELKTEISSLKEENRQLKDLINHTNENMKEHMLDIIKDEFKKYNSRDHNITIENNSYKDINKLNKKTTDTNTRINECERKIKDMGNIIDTLIINIKQVQERIDKHAVSNLRHNKSLEENRAHITSIQQELLSLEQQIYFISNEWNKS